MVKSQRLRVRAQRVTIDTPELVRESTARCCRRQLRQLAGGGGKSNARQHNIGLHTELLSRGEAGGVLYNVYVYVCSAEREAQVLSPEGG